MDSTNTNPTLLDPRCWQARRPLYAILLVLAFSQYLSADSPPADIPLDNTLDNAGALAGKQQEDLRSAIERSLPYIAEQGQWWIDEKDCMSCHRVSNMLWTLGQAKNAGFKLDADLDEVLSWSVDSTLAEDSEGVADVAKNKEGIAQLIVSSNPKVLENRELLSKFQQVLAELQSDTGRWKPDGQLPAQKRPKEETADVSTAWILLAIETAFPDDSLSEVRRKASSAISERTSAVSIEWFAVRLLLAQTVGNDAERNRFRTELLERQHADGGWGWLAKDPSDALGTGLALYALTKTNRNAGSKATWRTKALEFLINSQQANGAWEVRGTKKAKQKQVEETSSYWGTTWATLGMLAALPGPTPASSENHAQ